VAGTSSITRKPEHINPQKTVLTRTAVRIKGITTHCPQLTSKTNQTKNKENRRTGDLKE
jgi:hypothetical protein